MSEGIVKNPDEAIAYVSVEFRRQFEFGRGAVCKPAVCRVSVTMNT